MEARLIIHGNHPGPWNMAVDEALLRSVAQQGTPCLRFYQWSPPCLSIGYFQSMQERCTHAPSSAAPCVRRPTGGGAIMHHFELTYSLVIPAHRRTGQSFELYRIVHLAAVTVLKRFGVVAQMLDHPMRRRTQPHFLCFLRRAPGDVVAADNKILGSAQRRWRNALLQHGSLIFRPSPFAPEVHGLMACVDHVPEDVSMWVELWSRLIGSRLGCQWTPTNLTDSEHACAEELLRAKYSTPAWNARHQH